MPPHYQKDTGRSRREARHRKKKLHDAMAGRHHDYERWSSDIFQGECKWCGKQEHDPIHEEAQVRIV